MRKFNRHNAKRRKRTAALLLILSFIIAVLPTFSLSAEADIEEITIVREETDRRNANERHYLCSDGSIMAVAFSGDVHYLDADTMTDEYQALLDERNAYLIEHANHFNYEKYELYPYLDFCSLTVLLYTDAAQNFEFEKIVYDGASGGVILNARESWFCGFNSFEQDPNESGFWLTSPQIDQAIKSCIGEVTFAENLCALRECIRYFDISKEELIEANQKMQQDPEYVRELLPFLTDEEFELAKYENGLYCKYSLPDFAIEALYLEDTEMAYRLLSKPYSLYVKEWNRMITCMDIKNGEGFINELLACDLTSDSVVEFLEHCASDQCNCRIGDDKIEMIRSAREAQLQAKQTGDGALTSVIVLTLTVPTLAALVWVRKKRKI